MIRYSFISLDEIYKGRRRAFTFIEILLALAILALAVLPSLNVFKNFKRYTLNTEDIQLGLRLAQERIEEYKSISYPELIDMINKGQKNVESNVLVPTQSAPGGLKYTHEQYKKYKRKTTLGLLNNDENTVLITVHVWWYDGMVAAGDQRFIILKALVCKDLVL